MARTRRLNAIDQHGSGSNEVAEDISILAVGGDGFTHNADSELEDFLLSLAPTRPGIGFAGTASGDDPVKIRRFYERFDGLGSLSHLPREATGDAAAAWLASLDIVYVGGGNTGRLVTLWRDNGVATAMLDAARRGVVFASVSAGAVCWFDAALSNSGGEGFRALPCLGLAGGSCCPHYAEEPERRPAFRNHIARGALPDGLAIDDGAAVLVGSSGPRLVVSTRPGANAYSVRRAGAERRTGSRRGSCLCA